MPEKDHQGAELPQKLCPTDKNTVFQARTDSVETSLASPLATAWRAGANLRGGNRATIFYWICRRRSCRVPDWPISGQSVCRTPSTGSVQANFDRNMNIEILTRDKDKMPKKRSD